MSSTNRGNPHFSQLNAQAALQQHEMQRQMFERERMMHLAASSQMPHAAQFQMQEEFLRYGGQGDSTPAYFIHPLTLYFTSLPGNGSVN